MAGGDLPGDAGRSAVDLSGQIPGSVIRLSDGRRAEGAGLDDVGAYAEIGVVNIRHHVRASQAEDVEVAGKVVRMLPEPAPSVVTLLQTSPLQHRAERAVQYQNSFAETALQLSPPDGRVRRQSAHASGSAALADGVAMRPRRPSHQQIA